MFIGKPFRVECSYPDEHAEHHVKHPLTGRLVCERCHAIPPAAGKVSTALQRFIDMGGHRGS